LFFHEHGFSSPPSSLGLFSAARGSLQGASASSADWGRIILGHLGVPRFEILWGGEPVSVACAQLIASYVPEVSEWPVGGFENPTIGKAGTEELKVAIGRLPQLAELRRPQVEEETDAACDSADWIAFRTGYAIAGDTNTTAFLALTFIEHHGVPAVELASWCLGCGEMARRLSGQAIQGPEGRLLCATCAKKSDCVACHP
jgi:hypothetical protein